MLMMLSKLYKFCQKKYAYNLVDNLLKAIYPL